jgi:hypothetical protein
MAQFCLSSFQKSIALPGEGETKKRSEQAASQT